MSEEGFDLRTGTVLDPKPEHGTPEDDLWWERAWASACPRCGAPDQPPGDYAWSEESGDEYPIGVSCAVCGYWSDGWNSGIDAKTIETNR